MDEPTHLSGRSDIVVSQQQPILTSKLLIPSAGNHVVRRARLYARLESGTRCRLTLISAPAGFGKTTLLSNWLQERNQSVAWLTLDSSDNDPATFWSYVVAALRLGGVPVRASLLPTIRAAATAELPGILATLLNDLARLRRPLVLVLDNLHLITTADIHEALTYFVDHLPKNVRLILSSRADPPWALARLRSRMQLCELRAEELRFTQDEATCFFAEVMGLALTAGQIATLARRTEGWIAGLQMAALALQAPLTPAITPDAKRFVEGFSGTNRYIFDYLMEEVLATQPPDIQTFLLHTAVLTPICGSLADAVTGRDDGEQLLAELDRVNLFIVPLDQSRSWYRYHNLFADLLQTQLQQTDAASLIPIHQRASDWYAAHGMLQKAIEHAVAAADFDRTGRLLLNNMFAAAYQSSLLAVSAWLSTLPAAAMASRPWLQIAHAWVLAFLGRREQATDALEAVEERLASTSVSADPLDRNHVSGHIAAVRAYLCGFDERTAETEAYARTALDLLPDSDLLARGMTGTVLAIALRRQGRLDESLRTFDAALDACLSAGEIHLTVDLLWEIGQLHSLRGDLQQAADTCERALALVESATTAGPVGVTGYTYQLLSTIALAQNRLDDALRHAHTSVEHSRIWGMADALLNAHCSLAEALFARGETAAALRVHATAVRLAGRYGRYYEATTAARAAHYRLAEGDVAAAARLVSDAIVDVAYRPGLPTLEIQKAYARVLIAQDDTTRALAVLDDILAVATAAGANRPVILAHILQARAHQQANDTRTAVDALIVALQLAEPRGVVRPFVAEGACLIPLLQAARARGVAPDLVDHLLVAIPADRQQRPPESRPSITADRLRDPLSPREMDVLRLLVTGLSGTVIAAELHVAPSTVRSHIKHIYSKLDVHNRLELAETVRRLNLV